MTAFDWKNRLQQWNDRLLASSLADDLPAHVRGGNWLGFPAATDGQIAAAERRLDIQLPPSYRAFLKVSNGWRRLTHAIDGLWSTDRIQWFKRDHKDWIKAYASPRGCEPHEEVSDEEYFSYETPADFRPNHLKEALQISKVGDSAVLLLNPQVIDKNGEWKDGISPTGIPAFSDSARSKS